MQASTWAIVPGFVSLKCAIFPVFLGGWCPPVEAPKGWFSERLPASLVTLLPSQEYARGLAERKTPIPRKEVT
jgi:hypothetical protein